MYAFNCFPQYNDKALDFSRFQTVCMYMYVHVCTPVRYIYMYACKRRASEGNKAAAGGARDRGNCDRALVMSVILGVNEKFRQGVDGFGAFAGEEGATAFRNALESALDAYEAFIDTVPADARPPPRRKKPRACVLPETSAAVLERAKKSFENRAVPGGEEAREGSVPAPDVFSVPARASEPPSSSAVVARAALVATAAAPAACGRERRFREERQVRWTSDATGVSAAVKLAFKLSHSGFSQKLAARVASAIRLDQDAAASGEESETKS